jgi:hypothetical protein
MDEPKGKARRLCSVSIDCFFGVAAIIGDDSQEDVSELFIRAFKMPTN